MLRKGYICYDTRMIPTFEKESMVESFDNNILSNTLFDAKTDFHLEIGENIFNFEKGLHYLPMLCLFHRVKLIDNFENVKRYIIKTDDNYNIACKSMGHYTVVFTNIFNDNNENLLIVYGTSNNLNVNKHCLDMLTNRFYFKPNVKKIIKIDVTESTCSKILRCSDVSKIQNDLRITNFLENWDKNSVRKSFPPSIEICYKYENHSKLKELLKELYGIELGKYHPDNAYVNMEAFEINDEIKKFNLQIDMCESNGYFKFIDVTDSQFEKMKNIINMQV